MRASKAAGQDTSDEAVRGEFFGFEDNSVPASVFDRFKTDSLFGPFFISFRPQLSRSKISGIDWNVAQELSADKGWTVKIFNHGWPG
jgi:hypothetical protein